MSKKKFIILTIHHRQKLSDLNQYGKHTGNIDHSEENKKGFQLYAHYIKDSCTRNEQATQH
jgi:hypothetical protein